MNSTAAFPLPPLWRLSPESRTVLRRNLLVCAVVSVLIHACLVWVGSLRGHAAIPAHTGSHMTALEPLVMPTIPPDLQDPATDPRADPTVTPMDFNPTQPDIPAPWEISPFVVPLEPPAPIYTGPSDRIIINPNPPGFIRAEPAYLVGQLDKRPVAVLQGRPVYPFELRQLGASGQAVVDFVVDARGYVHDAVVASSTHDAFGLSAAAAVGKWRFTPGTKAGKAVRTQMQVLVRFSISDQE